MMYVDLNPVRAQMAATPEESDYTGAKERIDDLRFLISTGPDDQVQLVMSTSSEATHDWERLDNAHSGWMCPIEINEAKDPIGSDPNPGSRRASLKGVLNMPLNQYLGLLDWTGRAIRSDKPGSIPTNLEPIFDRIGVNPETFLDSVLVYGGRMKDSFIRATETPNRSSVENEHISSSG